jgi:hypothetical protein
VDITFRETYSLSLQVFIFSPEDGGSMCLQPRSGFTTQKNVDVFTALRTSYLTKSHLYYLLSSRMAGHKQLTVLFGSNRNEIFQGYCCHMCINSLIALMLEAASTSETSVNFYRTTRRNILEDSHLHTGRRENLKYHQANTRCG